MTGSKACILDTNIIIDLFRGRSEIARQLDKLTEVFVPVPVLGELYLGAESSSNKSHHISQIEFLLSHVKLLYPTKETAAIYGRVKVQLKRKGRPIPENDIWIAALAIEHGLQLITRDNHFKELPELEMATW